VRLLDRHTRGIAPTKYGDALVKRSTAVFDELKQSVRDISVMTYSVNVRMGMLASGYFITTFPGVIPRFHPDRRAIKVLPVELPGRQVPVVIATLKNRALNPERFIAHTRLHASDAVCQTWASSARTRLRSSH
jgi:DNA-binding transcriptional LysR family regulator